MIRVLVVDDEPLAREGLRTRLELERDVTVVGEAEDGPGALAAILEHLPDLVFLDVQMPGFDGFEVLKRLDGRHSPVVVFATAFDQYAIDAFEAHALDYLLKPFNAARYQDVLERARREVERENTVERQARIRDLVSSPDSAATPQAAGPVAGVGGRITVRDGEKYLLLDPATISHVESAGNYAILHCQGKRHQLRRTLTSLAEELVGLGFTRIHRSTLVNVAMVKEVNPEWHGDFDVTLDDGTVVRMSRTYKSALLG